MSIQLWMRKVGGRKDEGIEEDEEEVSLSAWARKLSDHIYPPRTHCTPPLGNRLPRPCQPIVQLFRSQPMSHLCTVKSGNVVRHSRNRQVQSGKSFKLATQMHQATIHCCPNPRTTPHLCVNQRLTAPSSALLAIVKLKPSGSTSVPGASENS